MVNTFSVGSIVRDMKQIPKTASDRYAAIDLRETFG